MSLLAPAESYGSGGDHWLGSRHAVAEAESGTLLASAFADEVENNLVPSGYPVQPNDDGRYVPFDGGPGLRFVIGDQSVAWGDRAVPLLWHGRIKPDHLPVDDFTAPAGTQFTFVGVNPTDGDGDGGEDGDD